MLTPAPPTLEAFSRDANLHAFRPRTCDELADEIDQLIAKLDPQVSDKDVSLIVKLHLAAEPPPPQVSAEALVELFAQEMEAFVEGNRDDAGAAPLDPNWFGR